MDRDCEAREVDPHQNSEQAKQREQDRASSPRANLRYQPITSSLVLLLAAGQSEGEQAKNEQDETCCQCESQRIGRAHTQQLTEPLLNVPLKFESINRRIH